jgi:Ca2+-binding RTX toxin-like protein
VGGGHVKASGGDNNTVNAASDTIDGGRGSDILVGDVMTKADAAIRFSVGVGLNNYTGKPDGPFDNYYGGRDNSLTFACDALEGGKGDDILVGDVWSNPATAQIDIFIASSQYNSISAFSDKLYGGDGDDLIHGDFFDGTAAVLPTLTILGDFTGREMLFADEIDGGSGNDTLAGGLGADTITGGEGGDTFHFSAGDLTDIAGLGTPPVDVITDFASDLDPTPAAGANDVLSVGALLASFGFDAAADAGTDWLILVPSGTDAVLRLDRDGAGGAFAFVDVAVLQGLDASISVDDLVANGQLLLA